MAASVAFDDSETAAAGAYALPRPLAPADTLNDAEREIVGDRLRLIAQQTGGAEVRVLPTAFELCTETESAKSNLAAQVFPLFEDQKDVEVRAGCRSLTVLTPPRFAATDFRRSFLTGEDTIDLAKVFEEIVAQFPTACEVQVDSSTVANAPLSKTFLGQERPIATTPGFQGIYIRERIRVQLEDAASRAGSGIKAGTEVYLNIESELRWKPASANRWARVKTLHDLSPRWLNADASTSSARCAKGLVEALARR